MQYTLDLDSPFHWKLNHENYVEEVLQNVQLLCATRKGSVSHYRDFGLSWEWLDKPAAVAQAMLHAELQDALAQYEPRAEIDSITFAGDTSQPETLKILLQLEISEESGGRA